MTLLGGALRAWRLGSPALTSDEAMSWRLASYPLAGMLPQASLERATADVHPPVYHLVLHLWLRLWGDGPLALRGLSSEQRFDMESALIGAGHEW